MSKRRRIADKDTPVLFLTARDHIVDCVMGSELDLGD